MTIVHLRFQDELAEPQHAVVQYDEVTGEFSIRNLNSTGGLFLNGTNVISATCLLSHGATLQFSDKGPTYVFCISQVSHTNSGLISLIQFFNFFLLQTADDATAFVQANYQFTSYYPKVSSYFTTNVR